MTQDSPVFHNMGNPYLQAFFEHTLKPFRSACNATFKLEISGLQPFIDYDAVQNDDSSLLQDLPHAFQTSLQVSAKNSYPPRQHVAHESQLTSARGSSAKSSSTICALWILEQLEQYGLDITFVDPLQRVDCIHVKAINLNTLENCCFDFSLDSLSELIELSSEVQLSVLNVLLIKLLTKFICRQKQLYKAIVLDLDETLWPSILAETGEEELAVKLSSDQGRPFIKFMRWIRALTQETGIYVAICSRNEPQLVEDALSKLSADIFPLRGVIDYVVANYADKSQNLRLIAQKLSISHKALVFIDDNCLVRDEVRHNLPEVYVPGGQIMNS